MSVRYQLVERLSDGAFHSGESLGQALGISRAAIWKQVRVLREMGLPVHAVRGRGYRLSAPLELLDAERIAEELTPGARERLAGIELHHELDSTNDFLRRNRALPSGTVCLAERQLRGRGRRGRQWVSPYGTNLYLSLLWRFEQGVEGLGGLSLAVGIALLRTLHELGVEDAGLKWPNDVLVHQAKLAGILVEVAGESAGPCSAVIGIGINVDMPDAAAREIDQHWTDLCHAAGAAISRNRLASGLLECLLEALHDFNELGLSPFLEEWRRYDLSLGREVQVRSGGDLVTGRGSGIDVDGAFLLETLNGLRRFASGEVSLRITE